MSFIRNRSLMLMVFVVIIILLSIQPQHSFAFSCANSTEPKELYKNNDTVFIGKAIESSYENVGSIKLKSRVTFSVSSTLKGDKLQHITIVTAAGTEFIEDTDYLVYAYKTTENKYLYKYEPNELATDTLCGATKLISDANYDLEQINELQYNRTTTYIWLVSTVLIIVAVLSLYLIKRRKE